MRKMILVFGWMILYVAAVAQPKITKAIKKLPVVPGAERMSMYLPMLAGKNVAVFANQTSMVKQIHLVDTLLKRGILVKKIFSPEHGFRGNADAGEHVDSNLDSATGLMIISLYGNHRAPTPDELKDVDVLLFDIQDVGVRFYTYISSLQYYLEAAIENNKPLVILDRPNPNGFYVDGPVLQPAFKSFVGMQPIPVVYGMTMGEYAKMLLGEQMLNETTKKVLAKKDSLQNPALYTSRGLPPPPEGYGSLSQLQIIPCKNYDHNMTYDLPVKPSPNLPNLQSILLYPSICYFEGTEISLGRGTDQPFQCYGHPSFSDTLFSFTPTSLPGAKNPPLLGKRCYGYDLSKDAGKWMKTLNRTLNLSYLLKAYQMFPQKDSFFLRPQKGNPSTSDYFFNKLAGNDELMWQLLNSKMEAEIRRSWAPGITAFKKIRKKYLLYRDFQ